MSLHRDQKKYLEGLRKFERSFSRPELDDFKMFIKRDKDEEELDSIAMKKLKELYEKYNKPVDTSKYEKFFKKNTE
jgi:hypothetical protein